MGGKAQTSDESSSLFTEDATSGQDSKNRKPSQPCRLRDIATTSRDERRIPSCIAHVKSYEADHESIKKGGLPTT